MKDASWPRSDLDRYILAALEAKGLKPAKPADKRTLLRRATFDLTGLPPTPEEMDAFLKDDSPDAFAKVVDRLLASPAYGERWGRHWLDLVRYTDSFDARLTPGDEMDCGDAWRYRDWVVDAFNRDLPYDQFVRDQIAGDLVAEQRRLQPIRDYCHRFSRHRQLGRRRRRQGQAAHRHRRRSGGRVKPDVPGPDRRLRPLPRPQVRPDLAGRLLRLAGIFFSTHILPNVGPKTNGPPMLRIPLVSPAELAKRAERQQRLAELEKQLKADARSSVSGLCQIAIVRNGEVPDGGLGISQRARRLPCPAA